MNYCSLIELKNDLIESTAEGNFLVKRNVSSDLLSTIAKSEIGDVITDKGFISGFSTAEKVGDNLKGPFKPIDLKIADAILDEDSKFGELDSRDPNYASYVETLKKVNKNFEKQAKLSKSEIDAYDDYAREMYSEINETLRGTNWIDGQTLETYNILKKSLDSQYLPGNFLVKRRFSDSFYDDHIADLEVGDVIADKGFTSTSLLRPSRKQIEDGSTVLIELPEGTNARYLGADGMPEEVEVLLADGYKFKLISKDGEVYRFRAIGRLTEKDELDGIKVDSKVADEAPTPKVKIQVPAGMNGRYDENGEFFFPPGSNFKVVEKGPVPVLQVVGKPVEDISDEALRKNISEKKLDGEKVVAAEKAAQTINEEKLDFVNFGVKQDDLDEGVSFGTLIATRDSKLQGIKKHFEYQTKLTKAQETSIRDYSRHYFEYVNESLRKGIELDNVGFKPGQLGEEFLSDLNKTLRDNVLEHDYLVKREVGKDFAEEIAALKIGEEFDEFGFSSTSVLPLNKTQIKNKDTILLEIPAGMRGRGVIDISDYPLEAEILLPAGGRFRVVGRENGITRVRLVHQFLDKSPEDIKELASAAYRPGEKLRVVPKEFNPVKFPFLKPSEDIFYTPDLPEEQLKLLTKEIGDDRKFSDSELNAIKAYTAALEHNKILRSNVSIEKWTPEDVLLTEELRKSLYDSKLRKDVLLSRTTGVPIGKGLKGFFSDMNIGEKFIDRGVVSTSLKPVPENPDIEWFEIEAPRGSQGLYFGDISDYKGQAEIGLAPDTVFELIQKADPEKGIVARVRIVGVEKHSDSVQNAWMKVVEAAKKKDKEAMVIAAKKWDEAKFAETPKEKIAELKNKAEEVAKLGEKVDPDLTIDPSQFFGSYDLAELVKKGIKDSSFSVDDILAKFSLNIKESFKSKWAEKADLFVLRKSQNFFLDADSIERSFNIHLGADSLKMKEVQKKIIQDGIEKLKSSEKWKNAAESYYKQYFNFIAKGTLEEIKKKAATYVGQDKAAQKLFKDKVSEIAEKMDGDAAKKASIVNKELRKEALEEKKAIEAKAKEFHPENLSFLTPDHHMFGDTPIPDESKKRLSKIFSDKKELSKIEAAAIKRYTVNSYANKVLRSVTSPDNWKREWVKDAEKIKNALASSRLEKSVVVTRSTIITRDKGIGGFFDNMNIGDTYVDRGIVSTTVKPRPIELRWEWFEIEVPAGTPARYIGDISNAPNEGELLLRPDLIYEMVQRADPEKGILARFRVVGIEEYPEEIQKAWKGIVEKAKKHEFGWWDDGKKWDELKFEALGKEKVAELTKRAEDVAKKGDQLVPDLSVEVDFNTVQYHYWQAFQEGAEKDWTVDTIITRIDKDGFDGISKRFQKAFDRQIELELRKNANEIDVGADSWKMKQILKKIIEDKIKELKSSEKWKSAVETYHERTLYPLLKGFAEEWRPKIKGAWGSDSDKEKWRSKLDELLQTINERMAKKSGIVDEVAKKEAAEALAAKQAKEAAEKKFKEAQEAAKKKIEESAKNKKPVFVDFGVTKDDLMEEQFGALDLELKNGFARLEGIKEHFSYQKKLKLEQESSINLYTGDWYRSINKSLREGTEVESVPGITTEEFNDLTFELNETLRDNVLKHNYLVKRQFTPDFAKEISELKVGEEFDEFAFSSTSVLPLSKEQIIDKTAILIEIPAGMRGRSVVDISDLPLEGELLLPAGGRFRVIGREDGITRVLLVDQRLDKSIEELKELARLNAASKKQPSAPVISEKAQKEIDEKAKKRVEEKKAIEEKAREFKPADFSFLPADDDIFDATELTQEQLEKLSKNFSYQSKLTPEEKIAIREYTETSDLNTVLRLGFSEEISHTIAEANGFVNADLLKKAIQKSKLDKDYLLGRTTSELFEKGAYIGLKVGEKFTDKGVTSTTLKPLPNNSLEEWYQIEAPEGTPGTYVGNISPYTEQAEIALASDLIYEVIREADIKNGIPMRVRVVGREKTPKPVADAWEKVVEESKSFDAKNKNPGLEKALDEWRQAQIAAIPKEKVEKLKKETEEIANVIFSDKEGLRSEVRGGEWVVTDVPKKWLDAKPEVLFAKVEEEAKSHILRRSDGYYDTKLAQQSAKIRLDPDGIVLWQELDKFNAELIRSKLDVDKIVNENLDRVVRESIESYANSSKKSVKTLEKLREGLAKKEAKALAEKKVSDTPFKPFGFGIKESWLNDDDDFGTLLLDSVPEAKVEFKKINQHFSDYQTSMGKDGRDIIKEYSRNSYGFNRHLRGEKLLTDPEDLKGVETLKNVINGSVLKRDYEVKRSFGKAFWDKYIKDLQPGEIISDRSFVSTSLNPITRHQKDKGRTVIIELPNGTIARYIGSTSIWKDELEILLASGTKLKLVSIEDGVYRFRAIGRINESVEELVGIKVLPKGEKPEISGEIKAVSTEDTLEAKKAKEEIKAKAVAGEKAKVEAEKAASEEVKKKTEEAKKKVSDTAFKPLDFGIKESWLAKEEFGTLLLNSVEEAKETAKKITQHFSDYQTSMGKDGRNLIKGYTKQDFRPYNDHLRGTYSLEYPEDVEKLETLKKVINNSVLKKDYQVKRTIRDPKLWNEHFKDLQVGDIISDKGFVSTSLNPISPIQKIDGRTFIIELPNGTVARFIGGTSYWKNELEILIADGTKFKLVSKEDGIFRFRAIGRINESAEELVGIKVLPKGEKPEGFSEIKAVSAEDTPEAKKASKEIHSKVSDKAVGFDLQLFKDDVLEEHFRKNETLVNADSVETEIYQGLRNYIEKSSRAVNKYLRGEGDFDSVPDGAEEVNKFLNSQTLNNAYLIHKDMGKDFLKKYPDLQPGEKIVDPAFISGTFRKTTDKTDQGVMVEIEVPKGSKGQFVGDFEMLLQGGELEVVSVGKVIKFRLVNQFTKESLSERREIGVERRLWEEMKEKELAHSQAAKEAAELQQQRAAEYAALRKTADEQKEAEAEKRAKETIKKDGKYKTFPAVEQAMDREDEIEFQNTGTLRELSSAVSLLVESFDRYFEKVQKKDDFFDMSISTYAGTFAYKRINNILRGREALDGKDFNFQDRRVNDLIISTTEAVVKKGIVLKRAFGIPHGQKSDIFEDIKNMKVGEEFSDKGFTSGSILQPTTLQEGIGRTILIEVPENIGRGMYVGKKAGNEFETEFVLAPGTVFRKVQDGPITIVRAVGIEESSLERVVKLKRERETLLAKETSESVKAWISEMIGQMKAGSFNQGDVRRSVTHLFDGKFYGYVRTVAREKVPDISEDEIFGLVDSTLQESIDLFEDVRPHLDISKFDDKFWAGLVTGEKKALFEYIGKMREEFGDVIEDLGEKTPSSVLSAAIRGAIDTKIRQMVEGRIDEIIYSKDPSNPFRKLIQSKISTKLPVIKERIAEIKEEAEELLPEIRADYDDWIQRAIEISDEAKLLEIELAKDAIEAAKKKKAKEADAAAIPKDKAEKLKQEIREAAETVFEDNEIEMKPLKNLELAAISTGWEWLDAKPGVLLAKLKEDVEDRMRRAVLKHYEEKVNDLTEKIHLDLDGTALGDELVSFQDDLIRRKLNIEEFIDENLDRFVNETIEVYAKTKLEPMFDEKRPAILEKLRREFSEEKGKAAPAKESATEALEAKAAKEVAEAKAATATAEAQRKAAEALAAKKAKEAAEEKAKKEAAEALAEKKAKEVESTKSELELKKEKLAALLSGGKKEAEIDPQKSFQDKKKKFEDDVAEERKKLDENGDPDITDDGFYNFKIKESVLLDLKFGNINIETPAGTAALRKAGEHFKYQRNLSEVEKDTVSLFSEDYAYTAINKYLRSDGSGSDVVIGDKIQLPIHQFSENLYKILLKDKAKHPYLMKRRVSKDIMDILKEATPGERFVDKGFASHSISPLSRKQREDGLTLIVEGKKDMRGRYIADDAGDASEVEFTLPPGTIYELVEVNDKIVRVRIVDQLTDKSISEIRNLDNDVYALKKTASEKKAIEAKTKEFNPEKFPFLVADESIFWSTDISPENLKLLSASFSGQKQLTSAQSKAIKEYTKRRRKMWRNKAMR